MTLSGEAIDVSDAIEAKWKMIYDKVTEYRKVKQSYDRLTVIYERPVDIFDGINYKTTDRFSFSYCDFTPNGIVFSPRVNSRRAYRLKHIELVKDVIISRSNVEFETFEEFERMFDKRFISEHRIKILWESGSGQHSGNFRRDDFHTLGKAGKEVVGRFLAEFKDINTPTQFYKENDGWSESKPCLVKSYTAYHHSGRDIRVTHYADRDTVNYASEYPGCGNGQYYLLVGENRILHLEND